MKEQIRAYARQLGFDDCRFTHAAPPATGAWFKRWLEAGCHGDMLWLARTAQKRLDPRTVLASVRSVITVAISYHHPDHSLSSHEKTGVHREGGFRETGRVARYARARDYHQTLRGPLLTLRRYVDDLSPSDAHSLEYIDTGPVLERDLAARAGVGFVGKHTNLVSRTLGNWFFLAEILTPLRLEPDPPEPNRCGTCSRCISACPTGAIPAPFRLDARRCISYLTIELKGSIPLELRAAVGNRIFGCDDCLAVCPWNRFAREGRLMREAVLPRLNQPNLVELLSLDDAAFRALLGGTPLFRSKRRGLLRNVCVALGNTGDPQALPALRRAATDREPLVAEHAAWAIDQITQRKSLAGDPRQQALLEPGGLK